MMSRRHRKSPGFQPALSITLRTMSVYLGTSGGTWGFGPATFGNGFIWEEGVGTMTVSDYLDSKGIAYPAGFSFAFVSDISPDGQWIAGWGGLGGSESWVVHIPAPSSLAILGLGGISVMRRRR